MSTDQTQEQPRSSETSEPANIVAWAGVVFAVVAAVLYGVLFFMLSELPSTRNELEALKTNAPALTRLLIVGASAGLLNIVSLILCLIDGRISLYSGTWHPIQIPPGLRSLQRRRRLIPTRPRFAASTQ